MYSACQTLLHWITSVICLTRHWAKFVYCFKTGIWVYYTPCIYRPLQPGENAIRISHNKQHLCVLFLLIISSPLALPWVIFWYDVTFAPLFPPSWASAQPGLQQRVLPSGMLCEPSHRGRYSWYLLTSEAWPAMAKACLTTSQSLAGTASGTACLCRRNWKAGCLSAPGFCGLLCPAPLSPGVRPCDPKLIVLLT